MHVDFVYIHHLLQFLGTKKCNELSARRLIWLTLSVVFGEPELNELDPSSVPKRSTIYLWNIYIELIHITWLKRCRLR